MSREALLERFFNACISGDRPAARAVIAHLIEADCRPQAVLTRLVWPTLEQVQALHRADRLSRVAHHYATRLMRSLAEQLQERLERAERNGRRALVTCGAEESEELGAQIAADLLEASGFEVFFAGGGVAQDELIAQAGQLRADVLVVFGAVASTVPQTRLLIDACRDLGLRDRLQVAVGGGVFNRAEGLAEEIGADLWAKDPEELVRVVTEQPQARMSPAQRTVGRRRKPPASEAA
jgi:methanogenic corrinoid protein MtbC1